MKLAAIENDENRWLVPLIARINSELQNCEGFMQLGNIIQICPHHQQEEVEGWKALLKADNSFAYTKNPSYNTKGEGPFHLILINYGFCRAFSLDQEEILAVIIHELGHILNAPELEKVPSPLDFYTTGIRHSAEEIKQIKNRNGLKTELYADNFANKHGYGKSVISSLEKYLQNDKAENREMIAERLLVLNAPFSEVSGKPLFF